MTPLLKAAAAIVSLGLFGAACGERPMPTSPTTDATPPSALSVKPSGDKCTDHRMRVYDHVDNKYVPGACVQAVTSCLSGATQTQISTGSHASVEFLVGTDNEINVSAYKTGFYDYHNTNFDIHSGLYIDMIPCPTSAPCGTDPLAIEACKELLQP